MCPPYLLLILEDYFFKKVLKEKKELIMPFCNLAFNTTSMLKLVARPYLGYGNHWIVRVRVSLFVFVYLLFF